MACKSDTQGKRAAGLRIMVQDENRCLFLQGCPHLLSHTKAIPSLQEICHLGSAWNANPLQFSFLCDFFNTVERRHYLHLWDAVFWGEDGKKKREKADKEMVPKNCSFSEDLKFHS